MQQKLSKLLWVQGVLEKKKNAEANGCIHLLTNLEWKLVIVHNSAGAPWLFSC